MKLRVKLVTYQNYTKMHGQGKKNPEQSFRLDLPCVGIRIQGRPDTIVIEQETSWAPAPVLTFQKT